MRKLTIAIVIAASVMCSGCWRRWIQPAVKYPVIPVEAFPAYDLPTDIKTEEDKGKVVEALFKAEKYGVTLKRKVDIYNAYARGKNGEAATLFE